MRADASVLLKDARQRAGLTQRRLAQQAETAQSVVARIELGQTNPTWQTLERLVGAAGFELEAELRVRPVVESHMLDDVARILALTPEERLAELGNLSRFLAGTTREA